MSTEGRTFVVTVNDEKIAEFRVKSWEASGETVDVTSDMEGWEEATWNYEWVVEAVSKAPYPADEFYLEAPPEIKVVRLDGFILNTVHGKYMVETKGLPLDHARLIYVGG